MEEITCRIHWLGFTVHDDHSKSRHLYSHLFKDLFGELVDLGHGGGGYRAIQKSALEFKIYTNPIGANQLHFHFDIPGQACEAIPFKRLMALIAYLDEFHAEAYNFTRLDLAFDNVHFEPADVQQAIVDRKIRTLAKRESVVYFESPFEKKQNGDLGTHTVQLGANQSERMITVYDKRGYTRLEFQTRGKRSDVIVKELLRCVELEKWYQIMLSHLLDFVDFDTNWWKEFKQAQIRSNTTISRAREVTSEKLINWIDGQVAPALSALADAYSDELIARLINRGRSRRGKRYDALFIKGSPETD